MVASQQYNTGVVPSATANSLCMLNAQQVLVQQQQMQQQLQQQQMQMQQRQPSLVQSNVQSNDQAPQIPIQIQQNNAQKPAKTDFNTATLCKMGQEAVQEIVSRTQEFFQTLKTLQPPNGL